MKAHGTTFVLGGLSVINAHPMVKFWVASPLHAAEPSFPPSLIRQVFSPPLVSSSGSVDAPVKVKS